MQSLKIVFLITLTSVFYFESNAQKIKLFGHVYYGNANFGFHENQFLLQEIKAKSIPSYGIKASGQIVVSESFGIGTGINFLKMEGKTDPVFVGKNLLNTNTTGDFTLTANSSYLQIPIELFVVLTKSKIKPLLTGGFIIFSIPLKEDYFAKIEPITPTNLYDKIEVKINESNEHLGMYVGSGVIFPISEKREIELRINYQTSKFFYVTPFLATKITKETTLKYNFLSISIGISIN